MKSVAIIGGGFSGTLTALQLLNKSKEITVTLINASANSPLGIAFSTTRPEHLLNVPAGKMSAFPDQPEHFINWLKSNDSYKDRSSESISSEFVPRFIYGKYLKEIYDRLKDNSRLIIINSQAIIIDPITNGYSIITSDGNSITADHVVLAFGNFLPADPKLKDNSFFKNSNYFKNPWDPAYLRNIDKARSVLMVGTGLTMVDCVLSLKKEGYSGKLYAVSPRGYSPAAHAKGASYPDFYGELKGLRLSEILSHVRRHLATAASEGIGWTAVIDAIRPHVQEIWQELSSADKKQFIHHLRHIWGVARHRLPQQVYSELKDLIDSGQMEIIGGRIKSITQKEGTATALVELRKTNESRELSADIVINCTGPQINYSELDDKLIIDLLAKKLITPNEQKMGIEARPDGKVTDPKKNVIPNIYAIGSMLRGVLWETTAVPEISVQAKRIAEQIIESA